MARFLPPLDSSDNESDDQRLESAAREIRARRRREREREVVESLSQPRLEMFMVWTKVCVVFLIS